MSFASIVGQSQAVSQLKKALTANRVAHAYLFAGPEGVGKKTTALGLGAALVCQERLTGQAISAEACGDCSACERVKQGHHPDVRLFGPTGTQIVIDTAREIVALCSQRPHEAPARLVILDEADRLNPNAANSLLKTLEEPAANNHLVLLSSAPSRLIRTILSRTQRIRFSSLAARDLLGLLHKQGAPEKDAEMAAALADGSVSRAKALLQSDETSSAWEATRKIREAAAGADIDTIMVTAALFAGKAERAQLGSALSLLARLYRDVLVAAAGAQSLVVLREHGGAIDALAQKVRSGYALTSVRRALVAVATAQDDLAANANAVTAAEALMLRLRSLEGLLRVRP